MWFEASANLNNKTGWLGRWIDRNGSDPNNPLQAISIDTALSKAIRTTAKPVCAINVAADGGVQADRQPAAERRPTTHRSGTRRSTTSRRSAAGAGNDYLARSRATYGLTYTTAQLAGAAYARRAGTYPTTGYAERS